MEDLIKPIIVILALMMVMFLVFTSPRFNPSPDTRVFAFEQGQIVETAIGGIEVMIIEVDAYWCQGGGCGLKSEWPKKYTVRMPSGETKIYEEYELK